MKKLHLLLISFIFIFAGCTYSPPAPIEVTLSDKKIDYLKDVKPILDNRCVSCHSCYNSPCQAKFSSFDGMDRGGSKDKVYLATRLFAQDPTRLFIDAKTTGEWRKKDFFTLTENLDEQNENAEVNSSVYIDSIMGHMLYDKKNNPEVIGEYAPEYDELICAETLSEVSEYQDKHPNHGMPYGFPSLSEEEYAVIMQWLAQGGNGPTVTQQWALEKPLDKDQLEINKWETFLNQSDAKHVMTARYLYEHYYLAHINFDKSKREFYSLVRSTTPSGEKIDVIATRRPYDDPHVDKFYYRFEKIYSTIVHKTHMTVTFTDEELNRVNELFIDTPWLEEPHVMKYRKKMSANPFVLYAQIPPSVRYAFLLDHSEFIIRTFIRGPVCKGQIALNVIHDHFWVMFQDPKYDMGVQNPEFLIEQADNLAMPIEAGSSERIFRIFSDRFRDKYREYHRVKTHKFTELYPDGWPIDAIWKGRKATDAPALNIYRHFDSASVNKGVTGKLPRTMWVIDYAHFERIYYALVAGFDVFGNVAHQTNIRRYMDFLRLEGEMNFLKYMPQEKRVDIFASWYVGDSIVDDMKVYIESLKQKVPSQVKFTSDKPKQEFIETLVDSHFLKETNIKFDEYNYFRRGEEVHSLPKSYKSHEDIQKGIKALTAPGTGFIRHATQNGLNVMHIRVQYSDRKDFMGTLVINRWHDNVNSLFGEENRLDSSKDTLDVVIGNVSSYPNVFITVREDDLPDFFDMLVNFKDTPEYLEKMKKYGLSRSDKDFWKDFDWFQERFYKDEPFEAGLYDLNRYYKKPW